MSESAICISIMIASNIFILGFWIGFWFANKK